MRRQTCKLIIFIFITACSERLDHQKILYNAAKNNQKIESIMDSGVNFCIKDISSAKVVLRNPDTWSPSGFIDEYALTELIGCTVRYVSFYYENGKFSGMIMRINPNLILYKGVSNPSRITIAGNSYLPREEKKVGYIFYCK